MQPKGLKNQISPRIYIILGVGQTMLDCSFSCKVSFLQDGSMLNLKKKVHVGKGNQQAPPSQGTSHLDWVELPLAIPLELASLGNPTWGKGNCLA